MTKQAEQKIHNYFAATLILFSGNYPFLTVLGAVSGTETILLHIFLILFFSFKLNIRISYTFRFWLVVLAFLAIAILQQMQFNYAFDNIVVYQFSIIVYAYLVLSFLKFDFGYFMIRFVQKLIKISLFFWVPFAILFKVGIDYRSIIPSFLLFPITSDSTVVSHALIHNFSSPSGNNESSITRNCGMFWEPGAFAGIILMAFIYFLFLLDQFKREDRRKILLIFFLGIISTQSTTGVLTFILLFSVYYGIMQSKARGFLKLVFVLLPSVLIVCWLAYTNLPFLGEKIDDQLSILNNEEIGWEATRFGTIIFLAQIITNNPLIGVGFNLDAWRKTIELMGVTSGAGLGNGMFILIAKAGIPFFLLIVYLIYKSIRIRTKSVLIGLMSVFVILVLLQGESWFIFPIIYTFLFADRKTLKLKKSKS